MEERTKWRAFWARVVAGADTEGDYLNQKRFYVKTCVRKYSKDQAKRANSMAQFDDVSTSPDIIASPTVDVSTLDVVPVQISAPVKSNGTYNLWAIPWLSTICIRYLQGVAVAFDTVVEEPPCIWRYSKVEKWLCPLPEG